MTLFTKKEFQLLWPFYAQTLIVSLLNVYYLFIMLYLLDVGLSVTQIGILNATTALFILLFEVPTGVIADVYGRKFSVILSYVIEGSMLLCVFFFHSFYQLLFIFAISGFGVTLSSGSREAWAIDLVKEKKKDFEKDYFLKTQSLTNFGIIFAGIFGAFLVRYYGLSVIWIVSGVSYFVSIIPLLFLKEVYVSRKKRASLFVQSKKSMVYTKKHPVLFYLLLTSFFLTIALNFSNQIAFVPFLHMLSFPDYALGYFWSCVFFVGAIAPFCVRKLNVKEDDNLFIILFLSLLSLVLLTTFFVNTWMFLVVLLLFHQFILSMVFPMRDHYLQCFIPSSMRATISSFKGLMNSFAVMLAMPIIGFVIDSFGPKVALILSGVLIIPTIVLYMLIRKNEKMVLR